MRPVTWKGAVSAIGISLIWGGNIVAVKVGLQGIGPMMMAGLTFTLGAICIVLWAFLCGISVQPRREEAVDHLTNGLLFVIQVALFYLGTHLTSASHAVILTNTNIFFVALLAHFFVLEDRLTILRITGLVLAFTGVAYLFFDRSSLSATASLTGNLIVLANAFLLAVRIIYIKKLVEVIEPSKIVVWQMIIGVPFFYILSFFFEDLRIDLSPRVLTALLYQGIVVAGFSFVASTLLLKHYSPTSLSVFYFMVPIAGVLLSYQILGEHLTPHITISVILVAIGIWIVNLKTEPWVSEKDS